ncbi:MULTISPECIES: phage tail protein [Pseudomonas]|uniref:phage tail-collar fiber domain-containing protein n=1 Tax=Pseudomonas nitroreducens TaxID=46680 RepID=UPI001E47F376|nr:MULTISPECIES: phage tail protein [Pseudomonas]MCE4068419.1 phage tail protein [Pseudomonas nitritireducens]MCE4077608.1 phage tail protein [Pseudomonas nitroreducens]
MAVTYYALLTTIGAGKLANATALGTSLKITQLAVGDGGGNVPTPDASRTNLVNEVRRAPLNRLSVDPANSSQIIAEQVIPEDVGGWWIREMGLYDEVGALIAYANCAPSYKPQLAEGSGRTQTVRIVLIVSNAASVELKIDPSVVLATREYVDSAIVSAMNRQDIKKSVRVATTASITLSNTQTVDGVVLAIGDRVLVKNQTNGSQNGIYSVATGAWIRADDADESAEVTPGLTVPVESGTQNADTIWLLITDAPIVLGTTALTFQNITNGLARLQSPAFTGSPTAPTPAAASSDASIATTAFVRTAMALFGIGNTSVAPSLADFNDESQGAGFYYTGSATLNPPPGTSGQGFVLYKVYGAGAFQLYSQYGHANFMYRSRAGTAWTNWRQVGQEALRLVGLGDVDVNVIADINDATVGSGMYYTSSSDANRPLGTNGIVLHKITGSAGFQLFQPGGLDRLVYRRRTGGVWQGWRDIDSNVFGIGSTTFQPNWPNASLDDCTGVLTGIYRTISTTTAGLPAGVNTASVVKFWIRDALSAGVYQVVQELINTTTGKRFTRVAPSNGTAVAPNWSAWREEAYTDSPAFTGVPTAPTAAAGADSTQLATTAFVQSAVSAVTGAAPATLNTLAKLATALNNDPALAATINSALALKAPLASPALTGAPTVPTAAAGANSAQIANTAFVQNALAFASGKSIYGGYQALPGGTMLQYGSFLISENGKFTGSFPIAFPTACVALVVSSPGYNYILNGEGISRTQYTIEGYTLAGAIANVGFRWIAIGY